MVFLHPKYVEENRALLCGEFPKFMIIQGLHGRVPSTVRAPFPSFEYLKLNS